MKSKVIHCKEEKIVLSVGMIVKNEEKHLDNCLSALKNLTDHISSELIIVDTGSTDKTKEIALKYTDKVYDFEWINDFAAARNFGLEKAKGKWFMFLDADEYFDEDCSEMIKFFSYPELYENGKWNSCTINMIDHADWHNINTRAFFPSRLARITPELHFEGAIHEYLKGEEYPIGSFSTKVHHYGYVQSGYTKQKRNGRNMAILLEELEKRPNDALLYGQIMDSSDDIEKKDEYVVKMLEVLELPENVYYINENLNRAAKYYIKRKKYDEALKNIDRFLKIEKNENSILLLDFYIYQMQAYSATAEPQKAAEAYEKYFETYKRYKNSEMDMFSLMRDGVYNIDENHYISNKIGYSELLCQLRRFGDARKILDELDAEKLRIADYKSWISAYFTVFDSDKDYENAIRIYNQALRTENDDKIKFSLQLLENFYSAHQAERKEFISAFVSSECNGRYAELMRIIDADNNGEDISDRLLEFVRNVDDWKYGYSEAIYLCMKKNINICDIISGISRTIMKPHFPLMAATHEDYAKVAFEYFKEIDCTQSIQAMLWKTSALETAVLSSISLMDDEKRVLFDMFVYTLSDYIFNIYNPELLNVEDADVLPELHRFGFYMTLAFTARNNGDNIGYIKCLKEALRLCEPMKDLVSFYLEEFQKELDN